MVKLIRKLSLPLGVVLGLCSLLGGLFAAIFIATQADAQTVTPSASGQRLITVHDNGQHKGILTTATSLREAFKEAGIYVDQNDRVEPALDEPLIANNYEANIYRARPITVVDGPVREKVMSAYQTPKQIAEGAGIILQDEDTAILEANGNMVSEGAGMRMTITRATPFTFVLYGKRTQSYTQEKTVGSMLKQKNITLGQEDGLSVLPDTPIQAGMVVELWRNGKQTLTEEQDIAFPIEKIKDADREVGYRQVKTAGVPGKKSVTYQIEVRDGREVARTEIQSVTLKEPGKQVEIVGAKITNTFSGSFAQALARLRSCESGGNYANKKNPKYRGAYQYDYSTWANYAGFYDPADAPAPVQDQKAWETYQRRGWQPWPSCRISQGLQDIYR